MHGYALHTDPVWRQRANFILNAPIENPSTVHTEQLWARHDEATGHYEICCIPFFIYGVSLGDIVSVRCADGGEYLLDKVISRSAHFAFRLYFGQTDDATQSSILTDLSKAPVLLERYSPNLVAVDIEGEESAARLSAYFANAEANAHLSYETARTTTAR